MPAFWNVYVTMENPRGGIKYVYILPSGGSAEIQ